MNSLDVVKSGQAEIRRMVSESEELQIKRYVDLHTVD
jgi:hypothetical protein